MLSVMRSNHSTMIAGAFLKPNPSLVIWNFAAPDVGSSLFGSHIVKYFCEASSIRKALNAAFASELKLKRHARLARSIAAGPSGIV